MNPLIILIVSIIEFMVALTGLYLVFEGDFQKGAGMLLFSIFFVFFSAKMTTVSTDEEEDGGGHGL